MTGIGDERGAKTRWDVAEACKDTPARDMVPRRMVRVYAPRSAMVSDCLRSRSVRFPKQSPATTSAESSGRTFCCRIGLNVDNCAGAASIGREESGILRVSSTKGSVPFSSSSSSEESGSGALGDHARDRLLAVVLAVGCIRRGLSSSLEEL